MLHIQPRNPIITNKENVKIDRYERSSMKKKITVNINKMRIMKGRIICIITKNIINKYLAGPQRGQGGIVGYNTSIKLVRDRGGETHYSTNTGSYRPVKFETTAYISESVTRIFLSLCLFCSRETSRLKNRIIF